jgi:cytochrome c-type biogenesis protein CcmH/NrfG
LAEEAQRALGSPDPGSLDVLAAAYAEAGRYKEAVAAAQKALSATPPPPGVSDRLSLYESGRPYHASAAGAQGGR